MATTASLAPPATEAEIRAAINFGWRQHPSSTPTEAGARAALHGLILEVAQALTAPSLDALDARLEDFDGTPSDEAFWVDLRKSEAQTLRDYVHEAVATASDRCQAIITEELVAAGVRFATEHPNAPRQAISGPAR